ncbi:MAG: AAA family ATPase [Euryarchaeota archaeon]|jgi:dephospho-CoA kinase|nr:AAA family ATPase [Euryarchaeota archaeon]MBT5254980.1 AAA family ATPase [Euryarchaeota archaeon]
MGRVFAVCGLPASGKGEFATILAKTGIPVLSMGDMIRAEVKKRNIEEYPEVFGEVAQQLRQQFGDDILAVRLCSAVDNLLEKHDVVLIEGLRGVAEYDVFHSHWSDRFSTIAVTADEEIRFQRIQLRGRAEDGDRDSLKIRDEREIGWGLDVLINQADFTLSNDGSLSDFVNKCQIWLEQIL